VAESRAVSVKGEVVIEEPSAAERTMARRTAEARATIPHVELSTEVEIGAALELVASGRGSLDAVLVRAGALALRAVPRANAAYRDARFELYSRVNVGVVVAVDAVYAIPTVFGADQKSLAELTAEIDELTRGAAERRLSPPAFSGATFTVWNAGALGLSSSSIVITPPHAGALTGGAIRSAAVMREGEVAEAKLMTATLACDHRILYGAEAARFLAEFKGRLERAEL
jgi:pyruvate dehydrogenase E2 component (dihydrolipoamide acetyltransferase)